MAIVTNSSNTFNAIGNREDLSDVIYLISPTETPLLSMIAGKGKATNTLHQWQTDALAANVTTNAQLEGADLSSVDAAAYTYMCKNTVQLSYKAFGVSTTQRAVNPAGRKDELAYQSMKKSKELKRDMESSACSVAARSTNPSTTSARKSRGLENFLVTNSIGGTSYANAGLNGDGTAGTDGGAITTGTARIFTETLLKTVISSCYTQGGDPDVVMTGAWNKQALSGFSGNATRFDKSEDKKLITSIDFYVSDFGELRVVPNRFSNASTVYVLESDQISIDYLEDFVVDDLAKIGLADRKVVRAEWTLRVGNEMSSGCVASLTTS